jgi:hypothetical protein
VRKPTLFLISLPLPTRSPPLFFLLLARTTHQTTQHQSPPLPLPCSLSPEWNYPSNLPGLWTAPTSALRSTS